MSSCHPFKQDIEEKLKEVQQDTDQLKHANEILEKELRKVNQSLSLTGHNPIANEKYTHQ